MAGKRGNPTWKKGQSGNPGGRPKRPAALVQACRAFNEEGLRILRNIARKKSNREGDRIRAVELILAYGNGKPKQAVELTGEDGNPIQVEVDEKAALQDKGTRELLQAAALRSARQDRDAGGVRS